MKLLLEDAFFIVLECLDFSTAMRLKATSKEANERINSMLETMHPFPWRIDHIDDLAQKAIFGLLDPDEQWQAYKREIIDLYEAHFGSDLSSIKTLYRYFQINQKYPQIDSNVAVKQPDKTMLIVTSMIPFLVTGLMAIRFTDQVEGLSISFAFTALLVWWLVATLYTGKKIACARDHADQDKYALLSENQNPPINRGAVYSYLHTRAGFFRRAHYNQPMEQSQEAKTSTYLLPDFTVFGYRIAKKYHKDGMDPITTMLDLSFAEQKRANRGHPLQQGLYDQYQRVRQEPACNTLTIEIMEEKTESGHVVTQTM
jgi:hypothetical protein